MIEGVFIASMGRGISRAESQPDGEWSVEFLLSGQVVHCLAADPLDQQVVYAGSGTSGILRSNDRGRTWGSLGLAGQTVKSIAPSRIERGTIFAGTKPAHMYVSHDGGARWAELGAFNKIKGRRFWFSPAEPGFTAYVQGIALSPTDPNVLVVGIELGAVVRSPDGGKTWTGHRRGALRDCHTLKFHPVNGNWVYEGGGSGAGAAFSQDAGETWSQPKAGLDRHYGWACAADPLLPDTWYLSASPSPFKAHSGSDAHAYIFRSVKGEAWVKLAGGLPQPLPYMPYALLTDVTAPGQIVAGLSNGDVWGSTDRGDSWHKLPFNLGAINRSLIKL